VKRSGGRSSQTPERSGPAAGSPSSRGPGSAPPSTPGARPGLAQTGHSKRVQGAPADPSRDEGALGAKAGGPPEEGYAADAYVVSLPAFEGPLDLLLHLIQKHELDILDIPVGFITKKYLEYLAVFEALTIDVASEYLVMAATLAHIKSKMLLPDLPKEQGEGDDDEEEEDPRAELVRRLLAYQKYKAAAEELGGRDTLGSGVFPRGASEAVEEGPAPFAPVALFSLLDAFNDVLSRTKTKVEHEVVFDRISITDRIVELTDELRARRRIEFTELFLRPGGPAPSRFDVIITFLAVLEMARLKMMRIYQAESLSPIHVELLVVEEDAADPLTMHEFADPSDARAEAPREEPVEPKEPPLEPQDADPEASIVDAEPAVEAEADVERPHGVDVDAASVDEADADGASTDEASADEASADEASADQASADEASAVEASADEAGVDVADAEEADVDEGNES
jgi:segregation and condensation protein A